MALQGTIDAFPLVDVLQLLAASRKTGRLVVEGDRGLGQLFVVDGLLAGGGVRGREGDGPDATVFELLRFGDGSFLFESGVDAPEGAWEPVELPTVLEAATTLLEEWAAIEEVVPSLAHRVALAPALGQESVKVDGAEWALLSASGSRPDVATVAVSLELTEQEACRRVVALVLRGLMVIEEPDPAVMAPQASPVGSVAETVVPELPPGPAVEQPVLAEQAVPVDGADPGAVAMADDHVELELDDEGPVPTDGADGEQFPEHFPIDDLLSSDQAVDDPWVTLEGDASDHDRFAAARAFEDPGGDTGTGSPFSTLTYAEGAFSEPAGAETDHGTASDTASSVAAFNDAAFSVDTYAEPASDAAPAEPAAFSDPAPGGQAAFAEPAAFTGSAPAAESAAFDAAAPSEDGTDEVLRQMSKLSPKAAEAIAAALGTAAEEPVDPPVEGGATFLRSF